MRISLSVRDQQVGEDRMSNAAISSVFWNCLRRILRPEHNAKWWYSTVHIVTAMVGAGVLSLPSTMVYLGWAPGMMMLGVSWIITLATMYQMIEMHEDESGRHDSYQCLGRKAFGDRLGNLIVGSQQIVVQVTANIAYLVTGGQALKRFGDLVLSREIQYGKFELAVVWISVFAGVQAVLSLFASFSSMTIVSLMAFIMSFSYSTIVWATAIRLKSSQASYGYCNLTYYRAFNALGEIAFAYGGHNVALEIQATMRSTRHKPSKLPMWNGVLVAYVMVAVCYFPVAGVGYWALGNLTCYENVLDVLDKPKWLIGTANLMLMLHLTGSYQVFALPIYDALTCWLEQKKLPINAWIRPLYVGFTCLVAVIIPSFGGLLGLFGGLALGPTTYFLPCIMWLSIKKPRVLGLEWLLNWACIFFGVVLTIVSAIGSIVNLKHGFEEQNLKVFYFPRLQQCNSTSTNASCPVRH
ncbi:lysine histidine transporter-like 2 [Selaginella moellendorffii]|uniref:lysine histidine transporter-like 2 n=1 Tax=Selaginella moellendorffii TaxID=88036 RepID=UPI000D1C3BD9|nr:lysine histidine transporter-like 2 [Selaginella moellendorffii]|eukprot:XP_024533709.1 lysine histidine transporter-like 2 [Selaginella moellendorffii]